MTGDILRSAADRIDAEDLPQTAEDTADFCDGARWATGQLRALADQVDTAQGSDPSWLPDWLRGASTVLTGDDARLILLTVWRWIIDANNGVGGDVGDLIYDLNKQGYGPEKAGLSEDDEE